MPCAIQWDNLVIKIYKMVVKSKLNRKNMKIDFCMNIGIQE